MQLKEKIALATLPYLASFGVWFALTAPALQDGQAKSDQLSGKNQEEVEQQKKLFDLNKLEREKTSLESAVEALRAEVPKSADLDLLVIDLEKMCRAASLDLVSVAPADSMKAAKVEESEEVQLLPKPSDRGTAGHPKSADKAKNGAGKTTPETDVGLSRLTMEVKVAGDYPALLELMKQLESYQRVIGINNVDIKTADKTGDKKPGEKKNARIGRLDISFMMTAYYLP